MDNKDGQTKVSTIKSNKSNNRKSTVYCLRECPLLREFVVVYYFINTYCICMVLVFAAGRRVRNRWQLAYTLLRNPSLQERRYHALQNKLTTGGGRLSPSLLLRELSSEPENIECCKHSHRECQECCAVVDLVPSEEKTTISSRESTV